MFNFKTNSLEKTLPERHIYSNDNDAQAACIMLLQVNFVRGVQGSQSRVAGSLIAALGYLRQNSVIVGTTMIHQIPESFQ